MFNFKKVIKDNRTLLKNNMALFSSSIISKIILLMTAIFLARYLGVVEYGKWGLILSFCAIISLINDFGLRTDTIRLLSKNFSKVKTAIGNVMILRMILTILLIGIILVLPESLFGDGIKTVCIIIISADIFGSITGALLIAFSAKQMMEYNSLVRIISAVLMIGAYGIVMLLHEGLIALAIATVINQALISIIVVVLVKRKLKLDVIVIKPKMWRSVIISALPFAIGIAISRIYFKIDMIMMSWMGTGNYQLGLYNASTNMIVNLQFLPLIFGYTIFPIFASLKLRSKNSLKKYTTYLTISFIIILPIAIIMALFPEFIIRIIFGQSYEAAALSLRILSICLLATSITIIQKNYLSAVGYQNIIIKVVSLGVIINILMNLYFIRILGFIGASITTVISEIVTMILFMIIIRRLHQRHPKSQRKISGA